MDAAYGLIGDTRTAALADRHGRGDWLCWPRFDAPPIFRRLIDTATGVLAGRAAAEQPATPSAPDSATTA